MFKYLENSPIAACIFTLNTSLRKSGEDAFRQRLGLGSSEWPVLSTIASNGPINPGQLCARLNRDKAHVSRDVASLVKKGLLRRRREEGDGRFVVIEFDPSAEAERLQALKIMKDREIDLTRGLSPAQAAELKRLLLHIIGNAKAMENGGTPK